MKTNKTYETPALEHLDLFSEGVLCASNPFVNLGDGGSDDEFLG